MIREPTKDEADALEALKRAPFSAAELASQSVSVHMVEKLRRGDGAFTVGKLRAMARTARRQDRQAALDLISAVLGPEYVVTLAPQAEHTDSLILESAQAGAAVGEVQRAVVEAVADGHVSAEEAREIRTAALRAGREVADIAELAGRLEEADQSALDLR